MGHMIEEEKKNQPIATKRLFPGTRMNTKKYEGKLSGVGVLSPSLKKKRLLTFKTKSR